MKKIVLIIISVIMLFSACRNSTESTVDSSVENSAPTQIDPSEEFDGVLFGMSYYEIISVLGKKPDFIRKRNDEQSSGFIEYWDEEHFNVGNADVTYYYEYDQIIRFDYSYHYDESEQEQFMNDFAAIKDEILRRYPEEIQTYYNYENEDDGDSSIHIKTENRAIILDAHPNILWINVWIRERDPNEDAQIDPDKELDIATFDMSQKEIIEFYGRQPDKTVDRDDFSSIRYENKTCFNVSNADVRYDFYKNKFDSIYISYSYSEYPEDSEESSFQPDYYYIKKKITERYFESANYVEETDDDFSLGLDDRFIRLSRFDESWGYKISVYIDKR